MKLFKDAEHAIRDASWLSVSLCVPVAIIISPAGFYVEELSKVKPTDHIAEVVNDLAETIRFPDSSPEYEGGASRRIAEGSRRNEAISQIARGE